MEVLAKIFSGFHLLSIFSKRAILDIWQGSEKNSRYILLSKSSYKFWKNCSKFKVITVNIGKMAQGICTLEKKNNLAWNINKTLYLNKIEWISSSKTD